VRVTITPGRPWRRNIARNCWWCWQAELRFARAWLRKLPWRQADRRGLHLEQFPQPCCRIRAQPESVGAAGFRPPCHGALAEESEAAPQWLLTQRPPTGQPGGIGCGFDSALTAPHSHSLANSMASRRGQSVRAPEDLAGHRGLSRGAGSSTSPLAKVAPAKAAVRDGDRSRAPVQQHRVTVGPPTGCVRKTGLKRTVATL
jgi:hypothetical protein